MSSARARLLILLNATAAASSFVGSWFVAGRLGGLLPFMAIVLGLVGVAYFTRRAEEVRRALRGSSDRDDG